VGGTFERQACSVGNKFLDGFAEAENSGHPKQS
jgi:hypothetical protein